MLAYLHPGCINKTYLFIEETSFERLRTDLGEYVLGQLIADVVGFLIVEHCGLRLFEHIAELLAVAANHLLMKDELGLEVGSAFDGDGRSHKHLGRGDIDEIWNVWDLDKVVAVIHCR